jgi:hypothetical protein
MMQYVLKNFSPDKIFCCRHNEAIVEERERKAGSQTIKKNVNWFGISCLMNFYIIIILSNICNKLENIINLKHLELVVASQ